MTETILHVRNPGAADVELRAKIERPGLVASITIRAGTVHGVTLVELRSLRPQIFDAIRRGDLEQLDRDEVREHIEHTRADRERERTRQREEMQPKARAAARARRKSSKPAKTSKKKARKK